MAVGVAALHIHAAFKGFGNCVRGIRAVIVTPRDVEIVDSPAVGDHQPLEAPLLAQNRVHEVGAGPAGYAAEAVVGYHYFTHAGARHELLERRQVGLAQFALGDPGVEAVAAPLRAGMDGEMLCAGVGFQYFGAAVSLQAAHYRRPHFRRQERVLAVGLHTPSPARVAEDVDVRGPERQPLVIAHDAPLARLPVLDAGFVADGAEHLFQQRHVE